MYTHTCVYIHVYAYIYTEREGDGFMGVEERGY